jgi:multiple sugar transport system ATP-binding protein
MHGDNALHIASYYPIEIRADILEPMGSDSYLYFTWGGNNMIARLRPEVAPHPGSNSTLFVERNKVHFFDPVSGVRMD